MKKPVRKLRKHKSGLRPGEIVVGKTEEPPVRQFPKKQAIAILAIIAVGVLITLVAVEVRAYRSRIDQAKVTALVKKNDCSDSALKSVSNEEPSPKKVDASIALLSYRASCYNETGRYRQALDAYSQLRTYYSLKNDAWDQGMVSLVDDQIDSLQRMLAHPLTDYKTTLNPGVHDPTLTSSPLGAKQGTQ